MASNVFDPWVTITQGTATNGILSYNSPTMEMSVKRESGGINPILYFKYVKSKFSKMEGKTLERRQDALEKAFNKAVENGQEALSSKFFDRLIVETRESQMFAKGIKYFIEDEVLSKYKRKIRDGHISDTRYEDYTRIIPEKVIERKKEVQDCFDEFVIYHYWNEGSQKDVKHMDPDEKAKMKDPLLFGIINENRRRYLIADWEDEYCDLTFDEIIDIINDEGGFDGDEEYTLSSKPNLKEIE